MYHAEAQPCSWRPPAASFKKGARAMSGCLFVDTQVIDTPTCVQGLPLKMVANRYTVSPSRENGVTILLAHASGTHKEHWEPTLEKLFHLQECGASHGRIREAWAFDWMTHGDSAVLNAESLRNSMQGNSIGDWGEAIAAFVKTRLASHRIIVVGHSAGCSAMMYSTKCFSGSQRVPYEAIILVEPAMIDRKVFQDNIKDRERQTSILTKATAAQRNQWDTRVTAYEWLSKRFPWNRWDERVRRILVNHGLRPLVANDPNGPVTTKCEKRFESSNYTDFEPTFQATEQIEKICKDVPIHMIFGENDLVPRYSQDSIIDHAKGRQVASVVRLDGVGHMIVQQNPTVLAETIFRCLPSQQAPSSHL
ncbi:Alpha/beta hydrolase family-domain-containing protein [Phlebopus sp. FC_14]|nr:Alpha/beta hydrolase family-domain-containing protein [Phlebopus sp. FC_14]